ncbi:metallophosphoesterase family protein [Bacillus carboniphilus]|uniref:Metallophosphoesterase family protein n=1 Tax=Bacillus carboniphilus TaxID=86663 RepID=A0ABN0WUZ6_9BACI
MLSIVVGLLLLIGILILVYMILEAFAYRVRRVDIDFHDFPQEQMRVFFISDIHNRTVTEKLIKMIPEKIDIVIVGGDLTDKRVPFSRVEQNITQLKRIAPVYFVWGNNDYRVDYKHLDALLLKLGVTILDNTSVQLETGNGEKIIIVGIDDMSLRRDRLDLALQDAQELGEGFRILISHNPRAIKKIKPADQIKFILSGHTHGGQIRLFGWGLYEKGSLIEEDQVKQLVSNGFGTSKIPLRLGAPAETHVITLRKQKPNI